MEHNRQPQFLAEFDKLIRVRRIYLATVRKDGTQSKAAPLWFTTTPERTILIQSGPDSWHTKRIRAGSPVIVWVGRQRGLAFVGRAELSDHPLIVEQIIKDYPRKYLMARLGLHRPTKLSFARRERLAIQITPLEVLPRGFRSQPGAPVPKLANAKISSAGFR
jgi:hypothetical protein